MFTHYRSPGLVGRTAVVDVMICQEVGRGSETIDSKRRVSRTIAAPNDRNVSGTGYTRESMLKLLVAASGPTDGIIGLMIRSENDNHNAHFPNEVFRIPLSNVRMQNEPSGRVS